MIRNISVGIDIGSANIRVVVAEFLKGENTPKVIGTGESISKGIRHGYIVKFEDAVKSISKAVKQAEEISGIKIRKKHFRYPIF